MAHYNIFRHHLAIKFPAYGHALWDPDHGNLYPAVEVGDVGYIREGKFHRLFNVLLPAEDESHVDFGVPENYEQLELNINRHINIGKLSPNNFCSAKVTSMPVSGLFAQGPDEIPKVSFSCPMKEGAVLYLPIEATGENTVASADFGKWIIKHIDLWFVWARQLGLGIDRMEDIILVTGTHRTRSWTNVAFPGGQEYAQASFGARADHRNGVVNWQFLPESNQGVVLNCGPDGENLPEDQCIFIRGFRVTRKLRILPPRLKGAAGPNPDLEGYNEEPDMELVQIPSVPEYQDPLHILLEYIAEEAPPDCEMVLVHDDDLARLDLDGYYGITAAEPINSLQSDVVLSHIRNLKPIVHSARIDLSSARNSVSADTEFAWVATLSNIFEKQPPPSTSSETQSLPVKTPSPQRELSRHIESLRNESPHDMLKRPTPPASFSEPNIPGSRGGLSGYTTADHSMYTQRSSTATALSPAYVPPRAPVSPVEQPWREDYRAAGSTISGSPYASTKIRLSPIARTPVGRISSRSHSSNPISSTSNIYQPRYSIPQCTLPGCGKLAIFDQHINEQREYCEEHIKMVVSVGFASCCSVCREMPARLDSEFCSESCNNVNARHVTSSGLPDYRLRIQPERSDVLEGPLPTCHECHGFMKEAGSRYCSRRCEEASRKPRTSRLSPGNTFDFVTETRL